MSWRDYAKNSNNSNNSDWRNYVYGKDGPQKRMQFDKEVKDSIDKYQASHEQELQQQKIDNAKIQASKPQPIIEPIKQPPKAPLVYSNKGVPIKFGPQADKLNSIGGSAVAGALDSASLGLISKGMDKLQPGITAQAQQENPAAFTVGKIGGYLLPGTVGAKLTKPLLKGIANPLLNRVIEGMAIGGGLTGIEDAVNQKPLNETLKDVRNNVALGGVLDLALGIPSAIKYVKNTNKNILDKAFADKFGELPPLENKINNPNGALKPLKVTTEPFKPQDNTNTPLTQTKPLQANLEPKIKSVAVDMNKEPNLNVPTDNLGTSQFKTNTLRNSPFLQSKEAQKVIDDIAAQYEKKPNIQSINRATAELESNFDDVVNRIKGNGIQSAEDAVSSGIISNQLRQEGARTGDYTQLKQWLEVVQPEVTNTAQILQSLSTWKKLSPDGALMKAQQVVGKVNRDGMKEFGKNFKKVELTNEDMKFINDTMTNVENMADGRAKDLEFAKVKQYIADKIPSTLANKVAALQRIQLLLNPKTMIRNFNGNVIMGLLENAKDIPGSIADSLISLKTGEKTTLAPSLKGLATQGKGLLKGAKETLQDAKLGVSTSPSAGQFELPQTTAFKKGILNKIEKATYTGLELGDRPFYQAAYDESLRQQMKINKVDVPTQKMLDQAKAVAEDRTFQNVSEMVNGFKKLQTGLNNIGSGFGIGSKEFGLGNIALPFAKTPANILDKAIDYSPLGSIKAIGQLMSKKTFNQKLFVDRIGRSITGSAAIYLGYELAKNGLLTGAANKDKDVAALEKQTGKSPYALKSGDTYRTIDWAQPAAIPLAIGADIYHQGKTQKQATNVIVDAIKSGGTTLFQQSLLQGVQKLFGGSDPISGVTNTLAGLPTQFIPGSLSTSLTKLKDPYVRDTYDPSKLKTIENQIQSKIPFLSEKLPIKYDTMGKPTLQYNGNNNAFNVLVNPGTTTKYNPTPGEKLPLDIYNKTRDKIQFPRVADSSITYTDKWSGKPQTIQLTAKEKNDFQKYIGEKTNELYSTQANYIYPSTEEQAKVLQKLLTEIYNKGKSQILKGRNIDAK